MRCFLTGATGFIGSHVLRRLLERGHTVAVLLRPAADCRRIADQLPQATPLSGTLAEPAAWENSLAAFAPDTLIHAAWFGVGGADRNHVAQAANIVMTADLAELAGRLGVRTFIGLGSQAEYGPVNRRADEQTPTTPTTLYGIAKLATAQMTERLCDLAGMRWAWLRVFSTYGPGEDDGWLIPFLIDQLMRQQQPKLTGCEQLWDFLHVADAAAAIVAVAETTTATGIFNLGSGQAPPLIETVTLLRDLICPQTPLGIGKVAYRPDQVMHLEADITRLSAAVGWQPLRTLRDGLAETIKWHHDQRS